MLSFFNNSTMLSFCSWLRLWTSDFEVPFASHNAIIYPLESVRTNPDDSSITAYRFSSPTGSQTLVLLSLNAKLVIETAKNKKTLSINDFFISYRKTKLKKGEFIHSIRIPIYKNNVFKAYKISKRFDDDISSLCASFNLEINNNKIKNIFIAFGGMAETPKRAKKCEKILKNKNLSIESFLNAGDNLEKDFSPISDMRATKNYRIEVARNLLIKCFYEIKKNKLLRVN